MYYLFIIYTISYILLFDKNRKYWDSFTRIISTLNSLQCFYMVYYEIFLASPNSTGMIDLNYLGSEYSLNVLFEFSYYLFVDGLFQIPDLREKFSLSIILSMMHHFVGGLGIYMIADSKMGFFLGCYFAMTEISTPFLNLSWFIREKILFRIFYIFFFLSRIVTIPFLLEYLELNREKIMALSGSQIFMSFYGSHALISLNLIWFVFMTKKMIS